MGCPAIIKHHKINIMKITVELTKAQVQGIKKYHKECFDESVQKEEIAQYIQGIVAGVLQAPQEAVSHYINEAENQN